LTLEALWKISRSIRILGKISLARIDRELAEPKLSLRNVVDALKGFKEQIVIPDIKYILESSNIHNFADSLEKQPDKK
jgi:hypothetical protein